MIDWDNAPEGAIAWCPKSKTWVTELASIKDCCILREYKTAAQGWNCEGVPPVGVDCEILGTPEGSWSAGVVDYVDDRHCVWHWKLSPSETMHNRVNNMQFRPIRTKEQRERDELLKIVSNGACLQVDSLMAAYCVDAILAAGYRKPESKK